MVSRTLPYNLVMSQVVSPVSLHWCFQWVGKVDSRGAKFLHTLGSVQGFARSLLYLETYIRSFKVMERGKPIDMAPYQQQLQKNFGFLQQIYAALESPDGMHA